MMKVTKPPTPTSAAERVPATTAPAVAVRRAGKAPRVEKLKPATKLSDFESELLTAWAS
jgi:hypothetical protein